MKHTLKEKCMQTALEKIASFAVHTDYEKIPDDVLEAAKLGLTDFFCLFSCRDQRTGQQKHP